MVRKIVKLVVHCSCVALLTLLCFTACSTSGSLVQEPSSAIADTTNVAVNQPEKQTVFNRRGTIVGLMLGSFTGVTGAYYASGLTESDDKSEKVQLGAKGALIGFPVGFLLGHFIGTKVPAKPLHPTAVPDSLK